MWGFSPNDRVGKHQASEVFFRYWLNSETPIEEVPLLSPCPTTPPPPTTPTMLSQNSGYIATRDTKLLPHLNGDPRSKTQNLKPKTQNPNPKTQISNLMLQWNYEHKTFDYNNRNYKTQC